MADEVRHHEEVADEAGLLDDAELVLHPVEDLLLARVRLGDFARIESVAVLHVVEADLAQVVAVGQPTVGHVELRVVVDLGHVVELHAAPLGDQPGVGDRLGHLAEEFAHLLLALEVELRRRKAEVLLRQAGAGLDAEHDLMRLGILLAHVVDVVGSDELEVVAPGEVDQIFVAALFLLHAVVHEFDEEVVRAEDVEVFAERLFRALRVALQKVLGDFTADAGAGADQPVAVLAHDLLVDPRLVVEPLLVGGGHELAQTEVPLFVLAEQHQMESAAVEGLVRIEVAHVTRGDIGFDADDRIDSGAGEDAMELFDPPHVAVVGDRHRAHVVFFGQFDQTGDGARSVEHAVMGVQMQMYEIGSHFRHVSPV